MIKIAFVCLGNICRSPLAEAIAKDKIKKININAQIDSFGTASWHTGKPPCENSQKIALSRNLDISSYRGSQITNANINNYDLVVGVDDSVVNDLKQLNYKKQIYLLGDFGYNGESVPDPYYFKDIQGFNEVFSMIDICVENFLKSKCITNETK